MQMCVGYIYSGGGGGGGDSSINKGRRQGKAEEGVPAKRRELVEAGQGRAR